MITRLFFGVILFLSISIYATDVDLNTSDKVIMDDFTHLTLWNIDSVIDSSNLIDECKEVNNVLVCKSLLGRLLKHKNWIEHPSEGNDGDMEVYKAVGYYKYNKRFVVISVQTGHASPSFIFWDRNSGGYIHLDPNFEFVMMKNDGKLIINAGSDLNNEFIWEYRSFYNNMDEYFSCKLVKNIVQIGDEGLDVDALIKLIKLNRGSLISSKDFSCKKLISEFDKKVE